MKMAFRKLNKIMFDRDVMCYRKFVNKQKLLESNSQA